MNGPLKMYRTRQIVPSDMVVDLPDCMYKMKSIHGVRNGVVEQRGEHITRKKLDIFDQNNQNIPEMAALEARQEQILQQLADLKQQMNTIRSHLKVTPVSNTTTTMTTANKPRPVQQPSINFQDVIINASLTHPPYSLQLIQKLWLNYVHLSVKSHLHSTVTGLNEKAVALTEALDSFAPKTQVPKVSVRLIWKDVGANTELIVSPTPIQGEINILRFLARLSTSHLNYENGPNPHEIDSLLENSYAIIRAKTKTERASLLQNINKSLGKHQWLAGRGQMSIADLAAYSAIKQVVSPNEVNVNVGKWMQRCEAF